MRSTRAILPVVDVVEVSGFLDPVLVGMMADTLESLDPSETVALVFQVDSTASVVPDSEILRLARLIVGSEVTVSFWVGPSGARATGPIAQLVVLGDDIGIAPGARLGSSVTPSRVSPSWGPCWPRMPWPTSGMPPWATTKPSGVA